MDFENMDITPELREKAKACTSPEELLELAKSEGYKLSEADLEAVSGGGWGSGGEDGGGKDYNGDSRQDIDPARVHADFVNGVVDGGEFD